jgi:hypothetical protein
VGTVGELAFATSHLDAVGAGGVHLFDPDSGDLLRTIAAPDVGIQGFGFCASGDAGVIVVGSSTGGTNQANQVWLFDSETGAHLATVDNPLGITQDRFGYSVALADGKILVGSPGTMKFGATTPGAAFLFDAASGDLLHTYADPLGTANDQFGFSVALTEGGDVLVGSPHSDVAAPHAGAVHLFDGETGAFLRSFVSPTPRSYVSFGWSVASAQDKVIIGARVSQPASLG